MRGGAFGMGTAVASAFGRELTVHQKAKKLAYSTLSSFSEYNLFNFKPTGNFGEKPELVAFAGYMINGFYGLINIQTENDVIALRRLFAKFKNDEKAYLLAKLPGMDKTLLQQEWIAAGKPEPIFSNIMKNAKAILDKASKKGLLRRTFSPRAGDPEDTDEAKNAVYALNEADNARTTASITAAEYADAIGAITYDATPYTSRGGGRNRKNKKTQKNKNKRKNNTRKYT
jgi:hypothetical protein